MYCIVRMLKLQLGITVSIFITQALALESNPQFVAGKQVITTETIYNTGKPVFSLEPGKTVYNSGKVVYGDDGILDTGYNTGINGRSLYTTNENVVYNSGKPVISLKPGKTVYNSGKFVYDNDGILDPGYNTGKKGFNNGRNSYTTSENFVYNSGKPVYFVKSGKTVYNSGKFVYGNDGIMDTGYNTGNTGFNDGRSSYGTSENVYYSGKPVFYVKPGKTTFNSGKIVYGDYGIVDTGYNTGKKGFNNGRSSYTTSENFVYNSDKPVFSGKTTYNSGKFVYGNDGFVDTTYNTGKKGFSNGRSSYATSANVYNSGKPVFSTKPEKPVFIPGKVVFGMDGAEDTGYNTGKNMFNSSKSVITVHKTLNNIDNDLYKPKKVISDMDYPVNENGNSVYGIDGSMFGKKKTFVTSTIGNTGINEETDYSPDSDRLQFNTQGNPGYIVGKNVMQKTVHPVNSNFGGTGYTGAKEVFDSGKIAYATDNFDYNTNGQKNFLTSGKTDNTDNTAKTIYGTDNIYFDSENLDNFNNGHNTMGKNTFKTGYSSGNTGDNNENNDFNTMKTTFSGGNTVDVDNSASFDYNTGKSALKTLHPSGSTGGDSGNSGNVDFNTGRKSYATKTALFGGNTGDVGDAVSLGYNFGKIAVDNGRNGLDFDNSGKKISTKENIFTNGFTGGIANTDKVGYSPSKTTFNTIYSSGNTGDLEKSDNTDFSIGEKIYAKKGAAGGNTGDINDNDTFGTTGKTAFNSTGNKGDNSENSGNFDLKTGENVYAMKTAFSGENTGDIRDVDSSDYNFDKTASDSDITGYYTSRSGLDLENTGKKVSTKKNIFSSDNGGGISNTDKTEYNSGDTVLNSIFSSGNTGDDSENSGNSGFNSGGKIYGLKSTSGGNTGDISVDDNSDTTGKTSFNGIYSTAKTGDDSENNGNFDFNTGGKIYSVKTALSGGNNYEIGDAESFRTNTGKTDSIGGKNIYTIGNTNIHSVNPDIFGIDTGKKGSKKKIIITIENTDKTGSDTGKTANTIYLSGNTGYSKNSDNSAGISTDSTGGKIYTTRSAFSNGNTGDVGDTDSFGDNFGKTAIVSGRAGYYAGKNTKNNGNFYFNDNVDFETDKTGEIITTSANSDNGGSNGNSGNIDHIADSAGNMGQNFDKKVTTGANSEDSGSYSIAYHVDNADSTDNKGEYFGKTVITNGNIGSTGIEGINTMKSASTAGGYKVIYGNGKVVYPGKVGHYTNNAGGAGEQGISGAVTIKG